MTRLPKDTIDKVKSCARIVDVVGEFCELRQRGINYVGLCPYHDDKTLGNFVVSPAKGIFKCFACGKSGDSVSFLMDHLKLSYVDAIKWLAQKYCIDIEGVKDVKVTPSKIVKEVKPIDTPTLPMLTLPMKMVTDREHTENDILCNWLRSLPWGPLQRESVERVLKDYHVGTSKDEKTIWWQIDYDGQVRTGKLMKYKTDGHRDRDDKKSFDWIHSRLKRAGWWSERDKQMSTCLFGLHLAKIYPRATVNIVESEKTAVIMAIAYGNPASNIWLATGGKSFITRSKFAELIEHRRNILLYPDQDGIGEWLEQMKKIGYPQMRLAKSMVIDPNNPKKDCGDFIIEKLYEIDSQKHKKAIDEGATLTADELRRYDEEQCKLLDMQAANFVITELIEKFDLQILY